MQNKTNVDVNDLLFTRDWTRNFLDKIDESKATGNSVNMDDVMMRCASICYHNKGMESLIEKFRNLDEFFHFLIHEWNWILSYDQERNILLCDENKSECICPVVRACGGDISLSMCSCTEGMLNRIFEKAFNKKIHTTLITSVLRGGKSCVYEVRIDDLNESEVAYLSHLQV